MTSHQLPSSPSRVKIALAVAWVVAALAAGGWTVEQSTGLPTDPAVAAAAARSGMDETVAQVSAAEESPALTLALVGIGAAAFVAAIAARIWWSMVSTAQPPPELAPTRARVSNRTRPTSRGGLLPPGQELVGH